jgi:CubicO group peptidase (beta-lactamase class C family)
LALDDDRTLALPGVRRIYSNRGIEVAAEHVAARSGRSFATLLGDLLLRPLGLRDTRLDGSPAHGAVGTVADLGRLAHELLVPRILPGEVVATASAVAFPGLAGVLPGFGRQDPNDWGLGVEVRSAKRPHWTSADHDPATFGHFGQAGSFVWVDRVAGVAAVGAGGSPFGPWAAELWPELGSRVLGLVSRR